MCTKKACFILFFRLPQSKKRTQKSLSDRWAFFKSFRMSVMPKKKAGVVQTIIAPFYLFLFNHSQIWAPLKIPRRSPHGGFSEVPI